MDLGYSGLQSDNKMNIPPHTLVGYGTLNRLKYGGVMVTDVRGQMSGGGGERPVSESWTSTTDRGQ